MARRLPLFAGGRFACGRDGRPGAKGPGRERAGWTLAEWAAWRDERLGYVLHRAATRVPYYRQRWEARRRRGDRASPEYLENWPVLEKDPLRLNPRAFVADDCRPLTMMK